KAGLVSTALFITYGAFQIINCLLCKRYNSRYVITIGLIGSGICNLLVGYTQNFDVVIAVWCVNGIFLSFLWTAVIRVLSESLTKEYMAKSTIAIGTTVAFGTFVIYGASAIFVYFNAFRWAFYFAGIIMPIVAIVWFFFMPRVVNSLPKQAKQELILEKVSATVFQRKHIYLTVVCFFIIAVAVNLVKDGLVTWVPNILKDTYDLNDSISIILTLALPCVAVFGNVSSVKLHRVIPDFVLQVAIMFAISSVLIVAVILGIKLDQFVITVLCFAIVYFLISSCNSVLTSIFPLFMKGKVNSGMIAGLINGFCYLGSAISSYALGAVADKTGWNFVFWLLFAVCCLVVVIYLVYFLIKLVLKKKYQ
ncbi:MAG: MFS transporter, partial [Clostridia bacterium]|nr:MFS transporter [Clostridia bacterium]